jgi:hypothetical protein
MKYVKEQLEKYINVDKLSYREIGRIYSVSDTYIKKVAKKLGIELPRKSIFPPGFVPANKGIRKERIDKPKYCKTCNNEIILHGKKYCSKKCQNTEKSQKVYKDFLENNEKYCRSNYSPKSLKKFFLQEQNNCCAICEIKDAWNNKKLVFVVDHIDGNAANNKRDNLRLICPNCDSQLDTYKSKNKNSARKERYLLNYKNNTQNK